MLNPIIKLGEWVSCNGQPEAAQQNAMLGGTPQQSQAWGATINNISAQGQSGLAQQLAQNNPIAWATMAYKGADLTQFQLQGMGG